MAAGWVVLELASRSEGEDPEVLQQSIQSALKDGEAEVFVPAAVTQIGDDRVIHYLVDGYVFVRRTQPDAVYLRLEGSRFVQSVLTEVRRGQRCLAAVPDSDIDRMRAQIRKEVDQGIGIGDTVQIRAGHYAGIDATVVEEIPEQKQVQVFVKLRSKQAIITLPRSFLLVKHRTPLSGFFSRLAAIRGWVRLARAIFAWPDKKHLKLKRALRRTQKLERWVARGLKLRAFVGLYFGSLSNLPVIRKKLRKAVQLTSWTERATPLLAFVGLFLGRLKEDQAQRLQSKLVELYWLEDVLERLKLLQKEIEVLAHKVAKRKKEGDVKVIQNLLVDGPNLAWRCFYAPGMAKLTDEKGRPTGMILGALRSLGSLRKRYPEARIYVAWDGSSQRRKAMYADYKADRTARDDGGQMGVLRKVLPLCGVWQVTNPKEEADDIIASLVRGPLRDQHNLIYSNDRDLLALVTETTSMLIPGVGSRKDILYDPGSVKKAFGVTPAQFSQLRAFCGDKSDNVPGVPRVPKKVLRSLVQAYGDVEGVYASSLTGISKGQYERLRQAEPQVRLNLQLVTLADIKVSTRDPDPDEDAAAVVLREIDINPAVLTPFFGGGR